MKSLHRTPQILWDERERDWLYFNSDRSVSTEASLRGRCLTRNLSPFHEGCSWGCPKLWKTSSFAQGFKAVGKGLGLKWVLFGSAALPLSTRSHSLNGWRRNSFTWSMTLCHVGGFPVTDGWMSHVHMEGMWSVALMVREKKAKPPKCQSIGN